MDAVTLRQYETLSPFEIKNDLAEVAARRPRPRRSPTSTPDAETRTGSPPSRGRRFFLLGQFAMTESQRTMDLPGASGACRKRPASPRAWPCGSRRTPTGRAPTFLQHVIPWAVKKFEFNADAFVHELVDSIIGDNYPVPDRMLVHNERIVREYLQWAMCGEPRPAGTFDAVRGRGRHGGDVLPLQVAQGEPAAEPGRHDRPGHSRLHAVPRDIAPRRLRPEDGLHPGPAGATLAVHGQGPGAAGRSARSRHSSSSIPATRTRWHSAARRSRRSGASSRSGPI